MESQLQELLSQMTLEEKVQLTIGNGFWHTWGVERLGVPAIALNDGPSGLRKPYVDNQLSLGTKAVPATCFPAAEALASSWDTALVEEIGRALAMECLANDVQILLGPGVNIKRTPLGGRCFEYYSEDPVLSGEMGCAFVRGVQSQGVGTSLKHFACNSQEHERMTISAQVDERTMREIYLLAFERVVRKAQPWTIMAAYNKVNGIYATEHKELLRDILKKEWGFEGVVVSDWGAVNNKADAIEAGLDLEMPGHPGDHTRRVAQQVGKGKLTEAAVDEAAARVLRLIFMGQAHRQSATCFDADQHHALARRAAADSIVLLKNRDNLLPLQTRQTGSLALIGRFAKHPRYQGAGSARVDALRTDNTYDELVTLLGKTTRLTYAEGYTEDGALDTAVLNEAVQVAQAAEIAIVFAGLTDKDESEGFDRQHLEMSLAHNRLIAEVSAVQPNTIVVLCNGSAVTMPWIAQVKAVLEAGLGGQAAGGAIADVLLGLVNPSGKLAETFALRLEDTSAYLNYPGEAGRLLYGEGLFVGYRYFDKKKLAPLFPFGYGLSYTTFEHSNLRLSRSTTTDQEPLQVYVTVRNTGTRAGKEVVQLYLHDVETRLVRPEKELKAFAKVALEPGESKEVILTLEPRDFAFYDSELHRWCIESGDFDILLGRSSAEITLRTSVTMQARPIAPVFTKWQTVKQFLAHPIAAEILLEYCTGTTGEIAGETVNLQSTSGVPLIKLASFGMLTEEQIDNIVDEINQAVQE